MLFNHWQISRDLNVPKHIHPFICLGLRSHVGRNSASRRSVPGLRLLEGSRQHGVQGSTWREEDTHREAKVGSGVWKREPGTWMVCEAAPEFHPLGESVGDREV